MTTAALVHVVVSGLATGSIYALMAISLVIIFNARLLNRLVASGNAPGMRAYRTPIGLGF